MKRALKGIKAFGIAFIVIPIATIWIFFEVVWETIWASRIRNKIKQWVMNIGKMTITEAYKHLQPVANAYGLRLNRAKEFRFARIVLANLYCRELV